MACEGEVQHPAESKEAAGPCQQTGYELSDGSNANQAQLPFPQVLAQRFKGLAVVGTQAEEANLRGGVLLGNHPVEITDAALLGGVIEMPSVLRFVWKPAGLRK